MRVQTGSRRRGTALILAGIALAICYFLFAGQASIHELLAACFACSLAMSFSALISRTAGRPLQWTAPWGWAFRRTLASLGADPLIVAAVLSRAIWRRPVRSVGTVHRHPLSRGTNGSRDAGRRALATLARSLAPREFVVDIAEHGDWLCVHSLSPSPRFEDRTWPL